MPEGKCQRCEEVRPDLRTIRMSCGYNMDELQIPFREEVKGTYALTVCKECRAAWLAEVQHWFMKSRTSFLSCNGQPMPDIPSQYPRKFEPGTGIFVRILGGNFEVTDEEWDLISRIQGRVGAQPYRYMGED